MQLPRPHTLVNIGAYCLMPNHFHLLLQEKSDKGIAKFMQKLGIAYAMYFNIRHRRTGNLFVKPFRSRHISDDLYFQRVLQYIHCNPAELYEPNWKMGIVKNPSVLQKQLIGYSYSSFADHAGEKTVARPILDESVFAVSTQPSPEIMLAEAALYYKDFPMAR